MNFPTAPEAMCAARVFRKKIRGNPPHAARWYGAMNPTQTNACRGRLLAQREQIMKEWRDHGGHSGPGDEWNLRDLEECAVSSTSDTVERRIADDLLKLLHKIDFALQRLDQGTYGKCEACGASIPPERLEAKPSVSLCIACQQASDAAKS
jgi:DnaK suppressor protein